MTETKRPAVPRDLEATGRKLWRDVVDDFDLNPGELALLKEACRLSDELETLRGAVKDAALITKGSMGQDRANPLLDELRKHRDSLNKTLLALNLPAQDEDESKPVTPAQLRAKRASNARWSRQGRVG